MKQKGWLGLGNSGYFYPKLLQTYLNPGLIPIFIWLKAIFIQKTAKNFEFTEQ